MNNPYINDRLHFLDNMSDYKVHHDDADIREWDVKLRSGETIGEIEGLLADKQAMKVRYVEVELEDTIRNQNLNFAETDRHSLIPVGVISVDRDDKCVYVDGFIIDQIIGLPRYDRTSPYTPAREIDTITFISDFHDYGKKYDRDRYNSDQYRNAKELDDDFYRLPFYTEQS